MPDTDPDTATKPGTDTDSVLPIAEVNTPESADSNSSSAKGTSPDTLPKPSPAEAVTTPPTFPTPPLFKPAPARSLPPAPAPAPELASESESVSASAEAPASDSAPATAKVPAFVPPTVPAPEPELKPEPALELPADSTSVTAAEPDPAPAEDTVTLADTSSSETPTVSETPAATEASPSAETPVTDAKPEPEVEPEPEPVSKPAPTPVPVPVPLVASTPLVSASVATQPVKRLVSLDALRGFDMCWILGLSSVVLGLTNRFAPNEEFTSVLRTQLSHVPWDGFHFYDLIFPLFLFIAGVSMAISLPRRVERDGRGSAVRHLIFRGLVLVLLGIFFSGGLRDGFENIRWLGVLQRIGIASAAAGILSLWFGARGLFTSLVVLLGGYYLLLKFVPVPDVGAGNFAEGKNLTNYLDSIWLAGRKYNGTHDPEGILSTLPAIGTALLGLLSGKWLTSNKASWLKAFGLLLFGAGLVALGQEWQQDFPVIKKIWTSSFVLLAGGWSILLLGVFYLIVDVIGFKVWTAPFVWVGANPITLYICSGLGYFRLITERLIGPYGKDIPWLPSVVSFTLLLLVARWMWKRQILIRV